MTNCQWIVVGAGFTGAVVAERIASQLDQSVLLIDRRDHVAGNAYDYVGPHGLLVHKYGPHIFHTNSGKVWTYLSQFAQWRPYFHRVLAMIEGNEIPIPFNLESVAAAFPAYMAEELSRKLIEVYGYGKKVTILKLRDNTDPSLSFLAEYVYDFVFRNYTLKQWGLTPEDLDPSVTARVPIHISRDSRYFQDVYQALPREGYTAMFQRMLAHPNIHLSLSTPYMEVKDRYPDARIVFTGQLDEYFNYSHGYLPYRSLRFAVVDEAVAEVQRVGTVNYPNEFDFTRITELKHLTGQRSTSTLLIEEYPEPYIPGYNEPYYPIPLSAKSERLNLYRDLAAQQAGKVWFAGRLGDYAYYNMDQACARALSLFEKQIVPAVRGLDDRQ